ncbi:hypothetical protein D3C84_702690 [compost metagenome]
MGLAIPLAPLFGVLQAEVGGQVDHLGAGRQQLAGQGMGDAMRSGEEHHVASPQGRDIRDAEDQLGVVAAQVRVHLVDAQARLGARSDDCNLRLWVLRQQAQQLHTGVTRAADDTDLDHHLPLAKSHWKAVDDKAVTANGQPRR